jgi:hypothetical protein
MAAAATRAMTSASEATTTHEQGHGSDGIALRSDELAQVTGGGIASQFGSMFGPEGAKWGGFADQIMGMFGVG